MELAELLYLDKVGTENLVWKIKEELKKQIDNKFKEEEIPIPDIDELIDEKAKKVQ